MHCGYTVVVGDNHSNKKSAKSGERAKGDVVQMQKIRNIIRDMYVTCVLLLQ